jgi:hypothetical protein
MRAFAELALTVAFLSAIVWFGHHHPYSYGYVALHAVW